MAIPERVNEYIRKASPKALCDDCIKDGVGLSVRQQAHRVTSTLATTERFVREIGECTMCKHTKKVIRFV